MSEESSSTPGVKPIRTRSESFSNGLIWAGVVEFGIAFVAILMFASSARTGGAQFWQTVAVSILILGASAATGCLAGFLFGVPKSIEATSDSGATEDVQYVPNSNLEQVSDWLTKIIVGVGLVEIRSVISSVGQLGTFLGKSFGDQEAGAGAGAIFAVGLLVGGTLIGFILTYMWTRTRLFEVLSNIKGRPKKRSVSTL